MVARSLGLFLIVISCAASALADVQLTPIPADFERDGVVLKRVSFPNSQGKDVVYYRPPLNWTYNGSATQLVLHPPKPDAEAMISKITLREPVPFDEDNLKKLTSEALASVPSGSTNVQLISQEKNPVMIEGKETFLIKLSYTYYGENYGRSVMFMNREKEQFRFRLGSRLADFDELQAAFLTSHFSWENL